MNKIDPNKTREILKAALENDKSIRATISEDINNVLRSNKEERRKRHIEAFSRNLKKIRENKKLTKLQVANMCGLLPPNYYRYESGQNEPGAITAILLSEILGVTVEDLFEIAPDDKKEGALSLQSYFEQLGFATSYDGLNTITIIRNVAGNTEVNYVTIMEAIEIKQDIEQMLNPVIQDLITAKLTHYSKDSKTMD